MEHSSPGRLARVNRRRGRDARAPNGEGRPCPASTREKYFVEGPRIDLPIRVSARRLAGTRMLPAKERYPTRTQGGYANEPGVSDRANFALVQKAAVGVPA